MNPVMKSFESGRTSTKLLNANSEDNLMVKTCKWCGEQFSAEYPNQGYCSPQCKKYGYQDRNRERQYKFYHRYGKDKYKKNNPYKGTGNLGAHRQDDFSVEFKKIEGERERLGLTEHKNIKHYCIGGFLAVTGFFHLFKFILSLG